MIKILKMPLVYVFTCILLGGLGCAQQPVPSMEEQVRARTENAKVNPAILFSDNFAVYKEMDLTPRKHWHFFFKNCHLVSRNLIPGRDEYFCSQPTFD